MKHSAGVIIVRDDGAVLLQHRDDKPDISYSDYWGLPAGIVEEGEDFKDAALRELREETDYVPEDVDVHLLIEEVWTTDKGVQVTRHVYWTPYDGKQKINCNEGQEMKFLFLNELAEKKIFPGQEKMFGMAIEKAREGGYLERALSPER